MRLLTLSIILAATMSTVACGPQNKDKLDDNELAGAQGGKSAETDTRCTTRAVSDDIKRQLFARAAEIRGSNGDNYAKIADFALIDVSGAAPVATVSTAELVDCRGHVTLRLPAGLKVAGGRTTLGGDVGYSVAPGARGMVTLGQSDAIAIPLATLTQNRTTPVQTTVEARDVDPLAPGPAAQRDDTQIIPAPTIHRNEPLPPQAQIPDVVSASIRPSFDCRRARSASERAVCSSAALAGLDRDMAAQYRRGLANADPDQRRLLAQTRDRFLIYRERCGSDDCIARTYRGRMREIGDILAGRWQPPR